MADLSDFTGTPPYATELFGVYQPLLGWKSRQTQRRVSEETARFVDDVLTGMVMDPRYDKAAEEAEFINPVAPGDPVPPDLPYFKGSSVAAYLVAEGRRIIEDEGRPPTKGEWQQILSVPQMRVVLTGANNQRQAIDQVKHLAKEAGNVLVFSKYALSAEEFKRIGAHQIEGTDYMVVSADTFQQPLALKNESVMAGAMTWLAKTMPNVIADVLTPTKRNWEVLRDFIDPLGNFDPVTQQAILSPLGLMNQYRQYFFELETFLAYPVGHVWISPGGTVELIEVSTRRSQTERMVEIINETLTRSELASLEQDELSDAVKEENQRDINLGISASGGFDIGVAHGEASANFGMNTTNKQSQEIAHKRMRQQSEKLSSEIRRNFHTTFRTVTENTDTSSRRYLIQNTSDKLINYELRRKMRRVGVQVQHIGTRMCWQAFVDDPGRELGVAELVHIAQPTDVQSPPPPPEAPPQMLPKEETYTVVVPFCAIGQHDNRSDKYFNGQENDGDRIKIDFEFAAPPPGLGYTLASIMENSIERVNPEEDQPQVAARYEITGDTSFQITLDQVEFNNQPSIRFVLNLIWNPPSQVEAMNQYRADLDKYNNERSREQHIAYVKAVRERLELAGSVPKRTSSEMRQEERIVVYRRLIQQLMKVGGDAPHVTSELIRGIFDVDSMLYFVAPEWWRPRQRDRIQIASAHREGAGNALTITESDKIGWGGVEAKGRSNYMITEETKPAPLGASLGWLLQLDGDNHRNSFLNSPWVKAVIPIRQGREAAALNWLQLAQVEGSDGLDAEYKGPEPEYKNNDGSGKTLRQVLDILAQRLENESKDFTNVLSTETVFERGFDPLEGGFAENSKPYEVFDQWIEILPTDQIVAIEYDPQQHL